MRIILIILFVLSVSASAWSQVAADTSTRYAEIVIEQNDNKVKLSANTPPLQQIAGAPTAFYTYFWEFGDGHYSRKEAPEHIYEQKGDYKVRLQVTNNYDNGKPPPSRPAPVNVDKVDYSQPTASAGDDFNGFDILKSREPSPEEELIVVMRYENELAHTTKGKLHLYYNEVQFKENNFQLVDVRTHHGEEKVEDALLAGLFNLNSSYAPWAALASTANVNQYYTLPPKDSSRREHLYLTLDEAEQQFRDKLTLKFDSLMAGEQRNVFLTMKTTPEMVQDTSALIKIRGIFVPDERSQNHQVKDLEMEIVTSHDPNKMAVNDTRINYRFRKNKQLKYKVRFQNNGEGPATTIKLNVNMPSIIDKSSLEVIDMYPECQICPKNQQVSYSCLDTALLEDKVVFTFKNIYLPGSNQKGVDAYDSTKGFVKYAVKLKEGAPKINSTSRTAIIFDKNEPIYTNYAKTYFKPGLSLGVIGGYRSIGSLQNSRDYFLGITASPYMPYRGYFQVELMLGIGSYESSSQYEIRFPEPGIDITEVAEVDERIMYDYTDITVVPISYRYNLNHFLNVGGGVQLSTRLKKTAEIVQDYTYFIEFPDGSREPNPDRNETLQFEESESFADFNPGVFAGMNLGSSRIGPCAGIRYVYQLNEPHQQWVFYLNWKF
ncbi:MAG: PKD domain-containing protein [Fulvivirga sp.]|nr:PKD domain-containing protein [Fulvivirga sp.]